MHFAWGAARGGGRSRARARDGGAGAPPASPTHDHKAYNYYILLPKICKIHPHPKICHGAIARRLTWCRRPWKAWISQRLGVWVIILIVEYHIRPILYIPFVMTLIFVSLCVNQIHLRLSLCIELFTLFSSQTNICRLFFLNLIFFDLSPFLNYVFRPCLHDYILMLVLVLGRKLLGFGLGPGSWVLATWAWPWMLGTCPWTLDAW